MDTPTEPTRAEPLDLNAAIRNLFAHRSGDMIIGLPLLLMFSLSFVGGWFKVTGYGCAVAPQNTPGCASSYSYGYLWSGLGILPAVLLVAAILFFALRRVPHTEVVLPVRESAIWMIFAVVEIALLLGWWATGTGGYRDAGIPILPSFATRFLPGWALLIATGLALLVGVGGWVVHIQREETPAASTAPPGERRVDLNAALRHAATRCPGDLVVGMSLTLLFAFSFVGGWLLLAPACASCPSETSGLGIPYISLWSGLGFLPALLLVPALLLFAIRRAPGLRLSLPVPEPAVWMVFAVVEIGLFALYWAVGKGYSGGSFAPANAAAPGWSFWVGIALAVALGIGGCVSQFGRGRSAAAAG
jgi:hypothetical protein